MGGHGILGLAEVSHGSCGSWMCSCPAGAQSTGAHRREVFRLASRRASVIRGWSRECMTSLLVPASWVLPKDVIMAAVIWVGQRCAQWKPRDRN